MPANSWGHSAAWCGLASEPSAAIEIIAEARALTPSVLFQDTDDMIHGKAEYAASFRPEAALAARYAGVEQRVVPSHGRPEKRLGHCCVGCGAGCRAA